MEEGKVMKMFQRIFKEGHMCPACRVIQVETFCIADRLEHAKDGDFYCAACIAEMIQQQYTIERRINSNYTSSAGE